MPIGSRLSMVEETRVSWHEVSWHRGDLSFIKLETKLKAGATVANDVK